MSCSFIFLPFLGLESCSRLFLSRMFLAGSQKLKVRTANVLAWQKYVLIRRQYFIHILFLSQKLDFDRHFHLAKVKYVIKA